MLTTKLQIQKVSVGNLEPSFKQLQVFAASKFEV